MDIQKELQEASGFLNFDLLAKSIVEGFISGMHKSPFHGFSAEFAEHKIYNNGESTRHIDWKLFAKTDKLYTKRYDEETNLGFGGKSNKVTLIDKNLVQTSLSIYHKWNCSLFKAIDTHSINPHIHALIVFS